MRESLRLLDDDGIEGFSLPKLGRALGADQTAVYRHFASKDDLVLAIADRLIEEAMAGLEPQDCWVDTLTECAGGCAATYLAHPAAASHVRPTGRRRARPRSGPSTSSSARCSRAGFEGAEAALMYRAVGDFALVLGGLRGVVPGPGRAPAAK